MKATTTVLVFSFSVLTSPRDALAFSPRAFSTGLNRNYDLASPPIATATKQKLIRANTVLGPNQSPSVLSRKQCILEFSTRDNNTDEPSSFSLSTITSPLFAALWAAFLAIGIYVTNTTDPEASNAILQKFLQDPIHPGVNELFAAEFNFLGLVAVPLACLLIPGSNKDDQSLPAAPFVSGAAFAGFGSVGESTEIRFFCTYLRV